MAAYPAIVEIAFPYVDVRDVAEAHVRAAEKPEASGCYICSNELVSLKRTVDVLSENGFGNYRLPKMSLTSSFGSVIVRQLARFQQPGSRSFIETSLGRSLMLDTSKIQDELGMEFRDTDTSIVETANDLLTREHARPRG